MRAGCLGFSSGSSSEILEFGSEIFALRRDSIDGGLSVICLYNFRLEESVDFRHDPPQ